MTQALAQLLQTLSLDPLGDDAFLGPSQDLGWGAIFGGQAVAQCLAAAALTVPEDRPAHSIHTYFLRPGDVRQPIRYVVERQRDGQSFHSRRVVGEQDGIAIVSAACSFQRVEAGLDHQRPAPPTPGPEGLPSERELAERWAELLPEPLRLAALRERSIEVRPAQPYNPLHPSPAEPYRRFWFRTTAPLPPQAALHRTVLSYASDFNFLGTALAPHGVSWLTPGIQTTSLDHCLWFHRDAPIDQWLLYEMESPNASGARGLVTGRFFTEDGHLVATVAQEGLIRDRRR